MLLGFAVRWSTRVEVLVQRRFFVNPGKIGVLRKHSPCLGHPSFEEVASSYLRSPVVTSLQLTSCPFHFHFQSHPWRTSSMVSSSTLLTVTITHSVQGKATKTRKFAAVKRMLKPSDPRL